MKFWNVSKEVRVKISLTVLKMRMTRNAGITAANAVVTADGTESGILIVRFFCTQKRYSSTEQIEHMIPTKSPCAAKFVIGRAFPKSSVLYKGVSKNSATNDRHIAILLSTL